MAGDSRPVRVRGFVMKGLRVFWNEIRERKVLRVSIAYIVVGWLVMQVAEVLVEALQLPLWAFTLIVILMILGFPMAVILAWAYEITPEGVRRDTDRSLEHTKHRGADTPTALPSDHETFRVAIVPLRDMSATQDLSYFCAGLAEEIQSELCRLRDVEVVSRGHAERVEIGERDLEKMARSLDIDALLEGSVRAANGYLRICFQLVSARTAFDIWNHCFNCEAGDDLAVQQSLAIEVTEAVKLTLRERLAEKSSFNCDPLAFEYLQRGRKFFRYRCAKKTGYALQMFEKAVETDPRFGPGWAYLACAHAQAYMTYDAREERRDKAKAAAARAMELAPREPMSWVAHGVSLCADALHEEADQAFTEATSIDPDCFEGWYFNGRNWARQGDSARARELLKKAAESDPEDYQSVLLQAPLCTSLGDERALRKVLKEGLARAERSLERHPDDYRALNLGATALLQLGQAEKARAWMRQSIENAPRDPVIEYNAACFYALAGDTDEALASLRRCKAMGALDDDWWVHDADLDSLRTLPEFEEVVASRPPPRALAGA
jgi:adenylate cyclase